MGNNPPSTPSGISGSTDNFIELANGSFSRRIGLNNWQWIRVAARIAFYDHPSVITPSPTVAGRFNIPPPNNLFFGFSYGTGSVVGDDNTTHAWGVSYTLGNTMTFQTWTTPNVFYSNYATYLNAYKYQNGVVTSLGNISAGELMHITQATCSCQAFFVDLLRVGTDNFNVYTYYHNSTAYTDEYYPTNQFYTDMVSQSPTKNYHAYRGLGPFPHDEATYGQLDSVNVCWNRDHPRLWLRDLHVIRLR